MKAEIISVGTELLLGQILNTNSKYLSERLAELGINVYTHTTVGDNSERLRQAFNNAADRVNLIITTGGLGPTGDDITRETLSAFLNLPLEISAEEADRIQQHFKRRGLEWVDSNSKQAAFFPGSVFLKNEVGTAPGLALKGSDYSFILLPGPPNEMQLMFSKYAVPWMKNNIMDPAILPLHSMILKFMGISESKLENILEDLFRNQTEPTLALYAKTGEIQLRITARAQSSAHFQQLIQPSLDEIMKRAAQYLTAVNEETLAVTLMRILKERNLTVSTAESCTGGIVSSLFTANPGSSQYYVGSVIAYSNEIKTKLLDIPAKLIQEHGAVSPQVAEAMAEGIKNKTGSAIGIGITGIAGPGGGTSEKPVGLVYIAVNTPEQKICTSHKLTGNRETIRQRAAITALHQLWKLIR